jgi:hypothetical protein
MALNLNKSKIVGKYYYLLHGSVFGPLTKEEILAFIGPDTEVRYEGIEWTRARDLVDFHEKWPPPISQTVNPSVFQGTTTIDQKKTEPISTNPQKSDLPKKSGGSIVMILVTATLLLTAGGSALYYYWFLPYSQDKNATRMYSYANSLVFRSSAVAGVDYNVIGNVPFGSEILVYTLTEDWAQCKHNGEKGVVSSNFLLNKEEFHLLNGIFADGVTREAISTTKCRKALLQYFKARQLKSKMDPTLYEEFYKTQSTGDEWQVIAKNKDIKPNSIAYPRVVNPTSKFTDFACIITNLKSKERRFILFAFTDTEDPKLVFEELAPEVGWISSVSKNYGSDKEYTVTYAD